MRSPRWAILGLLLLPAGAMAKEMPANPMTRDAVQLPPSFLSYEHRTGVSEFAVGAGFDHKTWLFGAAVRYHLVDRSEDQLKAAHAPHDGLDFELTLGNGGNLLGAVRLEDLCSREGIKADECVYSNLSEELQNTYDDKGPLWDSPILVTLRLGGSFQDLTMREATDTARESSDTFWGAHARLGVGAYWEVGLFGLSFGAASVGAAPAQVSMCTLSAPTGGQLSCSAAYLESYNRTRVLDARLEYRRAIDIVGFNPALQVAFAKSSHDDPATSNDDSSLGPRTLDLDLPIFIFFRGYNYSSFTTYAGLRGVVRRWLVDRPREWELMGGIFIGVVYGEAGRVRRQREYYD